MMDAANVFSRNILTWGAEKQAQLAEASILVAGVGGLGCTVAEMLVRSGVGTLIILDSGRVDEPDLNRQILYARTDLGRLKVEVAAEKLTAIHGRTTIIPINRRLEHETSLVDLFGQYNFQGMADCFDNFSSRFILERLLTPDLFLVHGGVQSDYGQITTIKKGVTPSLQQLYAAMDDARAPLPVCPQIVCCVGAFMAYEVVHNLWQTPQLLNTLLIVELSGLSFSKIQLRQ